MRVLDQLLDDLREACAAFPDKRKSGRRYASPSPPRPGPPTPSTSGTNGDGQAVKSTLQCKYLGKPGANLTLANLKVELPKAANSSRTGLPRTM